MQLQVQDELFSQKIAAISGHVTFWCYSDLHRSQVEQNSGYPDENQTPYPTRER